MFSGVNDLRQLVVSMRENAGLSQAELAQRAGLSRKWVNEFERGNPNARIGAVLDVLRALGYGLEERALDGRRT
ncbi:helix-turn-helix domain-containing protein [Rathayibacter festucae]|jgi:HTH-type transcriptional regulator/antitoxin HipB|uniref:helix-turn-helix domain-containing protein n=1 Tax=Rathayibacter festucae TaxID=110937 RepID=UPI002A6A7841|nr:helix-turn-helix domain-containing protein [Rathayibacter festucae]MDY0913431.1 helix-turn-helix domain-containing protein [Rathayibacter festucae]